MMISAGVSIYLFSVAYYFVSEMLIFEGSLNPIFSAMYMYALPLSLVWDGTVSRPN